MGLENAPNMLRFPRYGTANPERIHNPVWEIAVRQGMSGYSVRHMELPELSDRPAETQAYADQSADLTGQPPMLSGYRDAFGAPFSWERFGRTTTVLPDGRRVDIAGEHEDFYDEDFCIFNDVVVTHPDGALEIYGYPKTVFPPTDFHSATLAGNDIILIGSLGYKDLRVPGATQVFRLSTEDFRMERIEATGDEPGWIHGHEAALVDDTILIRGGKVQRSDEMELSENARWYALELESWSWRVLPAHGSESPAAS